MWGRIKALVIKELLAVWRDPKGRGVLIGPPILQLFLFSYAATLDVQNVDIAVLNRDQGVWSAELIQRLEGSPTFRRIDYLDGVPAIQPQLDNQQVFAVIHIGPEFSRQVSAGVPANVQLLLDGRRSNAAQIVQGYLQRMLEQLNRDRAAQAGLPPPSSELVVRHWFNPNLDFIWYTVPCLVAIIAMLVSMVVTGLSVARERELGTFDQLLVSPLRPFEILVGKCVPPLLIGMVHATVFVLAAKWFFGVPLVGSLGLLYASMVVYLLSVVGVGLFISALSMTQQQAILGAFVFAAPAVLLSGFATPVENMPQWLQWFTWMDPLRHYLVIVKGIFLKGMSAEVVALNTLPLLVIAVLTLSMAVWLFRQRVA